MASGEIRATDIIKLFGPGSLRFEQCISAASSHQCDAVLIVIDVRVLDEKVDRCVNIVTALSTHICNHPWVLGDVIEIQLC
jgi:hypothetical protein